MYKLFANCLLLLLQSPVFAQRTVDVDQVVSSGAGAFNYIYTVAGTPFVMAKFARVVEGSPFYNPDVMKGAIILSEGREYRNQLIRLNLLETQVNYFDEKNVELIATTPVMEVVLWDTINKKDHRFVLSDFIEADVRPEKDFYELLVTGKAELYKQYKKTLIESKAYGSATIEQRIITDTKYFVLLNGKWIRVKKLKDLAAILSVRKTEIQNFLNKQVNSNNEDDRFGQVIIYYNSLFSQ